MQSRQRPSKCSSSRCDTGWMFAELSSLCILMFLSDSHVSISGVLCLYQSSKTLFWCCCFLSSRLNIWSSKGAPQLIQSGIAQACISNVCPHLVLCFNNITQIGWNNICHHPISMLLKKFKKYGQCIAIQGGSDLSHRDRWTRTGLRRLVGEHMDNEPNR